ncbi:MAG: calcineurin-like phosphoesterase C-terminal domain-containing protein [Alistipes sp.]|nr:calcineurin-like phosphoesterase C-terminal domain-containing protein [Alistipes sp.]
MKRIFRFVILVSVLAFAACTKDATSDLLAEGDAAEEEYAGETVRFALDVTRASLNGLEMMFEAGDKIYVNGKTLSVRADKYGAYLHVPRAEDNIYRAIFPAPAATAFADSSNFAYVHSNMQVYSPDSFGRDAMCLVSYADLNNAADNESLTFDAMLGVLRLTIKGDAEIRSIRLQNNAFSSTKALTAMSGRTKFIDGEGNALGANEIEGAHHAAPHGASGMTDDIVLICNDTDGRGVQLSAEGTDFYFTLYPQEYAEGFTVTISDNDGKSQTFSTSGSTTVPVNRLVVMQPIEYTPDSDLLFSERFDTCVYGGDIVALRNGSSVWRSRTPILCEKTVLQGLPILSSHADQYGLTPGYYYTTDATHTSSNGSSVKVVTPGLIFSDYINEGTNYEKSMADVIAAGKLLVTPELLNVRGFNDWFMSRCVEFHGYLAVGNEKALNSNGNFKFSVNPLGILTTPFMSMISGTESLEVQFDIAAGDGITGYCKKDTPSSSASTWSYQPNATAADSANNIEWREDKFRFSVVGGSKTASILRLEFIDENGDVRTREDGSLMRYSPINNSVDVPESDLSKEWSRVRVQVANADANTRFRFYNNQATRYMVYHIDNIEVRKSDVISNIPDGVTVLGTVTCEGEPVAGVVVSDGVNVTRTDSNGTYYLPTDISLADHIRITIPSGYEMVGKRNISPAFFSPVDSSAVGLQAHDFQLKRVDQSNYTLMVVADSHVIGAGAQNGPYGSTTDRSTYCNVVMPKWNEYAASCPGPVYGVHLGDMTQVGQWRYYSLAKYRTDTSVSTVPIFNALGNHDHDKPTSGKVFSEQEQHLARKTFSATIGPAYYSFDIGTEHYIVLDNVVILDSDSTTNGVDDTLTNGYKIKVDPIQLQWLELDVAHIDKSKIKGIVICAHCPLLRSTGSNYMINAAEVIEIVKEFPVTALIGHNHNDRFVEKNMPTYGKTMREYLHPSLAGTAWLTSSCTEGTPASIVAYTFNAGKTASRTYVPYGDNENLRYRVYDKGSGYAITRGSFIDKSPDNDDATLTAPAVIVNAWAATGVSFAESSGGVGTTLRSQTCDPGYRTWFWASLTSSARNSIVKNSIYPNGPTWQQPGKSSNIWKYIPADSKAEITVTIIYEFGRVETVKLYAE